MITSLQHHHTLDAIDDEIFALIIKSKKDDDWEKILQNDSVKDRLTSQGINSLERNKISGMMPHYYSHWD